MGNVGIIPVFNYKGSIGMPIIKAIPSEINNFKIIKDLGMAPNKIRYGLVMCPICQNEFKTSLYHIKKIKSCGCLPNVKPAKELPNEINGFKILKDFGYSNGTRRALAICKVCKKEYEVDPNKLKYRKHCGCIKRGSIVSKYAKTYPRLSNIYKHMMARCYRKTSQDYRLYGAKGITVCEEWKRDRNIFIEWSLNNGYTDELSIDRIDSLKGYSPENCRWADALIQSRNTCRNVLDIDTVKLIRKERKNNTYQELANKYSVSKGTIAAVLGGRIWKKI